MRLLRWSNHHRARKPIPSAITTAAGHGPSHPTMATKQNTPKASPIETSANSYWLNDRNGEDSGDIHARRRSRSSSFIVCSMDSCIAIASPSRQALPLRLTEPHSPRPYFFTPRFKARAYSKSSHASRDCLCSPNLRTRHLNKVWYRPN